MSGHPLGGRSAGLSLTKNQVITVSAMGLTLVAATDLLLHASVYSADPDIPLSQVADLQSWLDLVAAPVALVSLHYPSRLQRLLQWRLVMTWPGGGPLSPPPGASTPVHPILIVAGLAAGLYAAGAALAVLMFPFAVLAGGLSPHLLGRAVLRPVIAWAVMSAITRAFPGSEPAA